MRIIEMAWSGIRSIAREFSSSNIKIFRHNSAVKKSAWLMCRGSNYSNATRQATSSWMKEKSKWRVAHSWPKSSSTCFAIASDFNYRLWHIIRRYLWNKKLFCSVRKSFSMSVHDKFSRHFKSSAGSCASWPRKIHVNVNDSTDIATNYPRAVSSLIHPLPLFPPLKIENKHRRWFNRSFYIFRIQIIDTNWR